MFIGLLTDIVNICNHTKCVSSSNHECTTEPTPINLNHNECAKGLHTIHFPLI